MAQTKPGQKIKDPDELQQGTDLTEQDVARVPNPEAPEGEDIYRRDLEAEQEAMSNLDAAPQTQQEWSEFRQNVYTGSTPEAESGAEEETETGREKTGGGAQEERRGQRPEQDTQFSTEKAQEASQFLEENVQASETELRQQREELRQSRLQQAEEERKQEQDIVQNRRQKIEARTDEFADEMADIREMAMGTYRNTVEAASKIDFDEKYRRLQNITDSIRGYRTNMERELQNIENPSSTGDFVQGRKNKTINDYQSKIATAEAEANMLKGNISFAFDNIDRASSNIQQSLEREKNFYNMVAGQEKAEMEMELKEIGLSKEEKDIVKSMADDIDKEIKNVQKNKTDIMKMLNSNPSMVNEADIKMTDSRKEVFKKAKKWYSDNPQKVSEQDSWVQLQGQDSENPLLLNKNSGKIKEYMGTDPVTGEPTNPARVITGKNNTYDFTSYAAGESTEWAPSIKAIKSKTSDLSTAEEVNNYIQENGYGGGPLAGKGEAILNTAEEYNIDPGVLMAVVEHESRMGTSSVAKKNNNLGGITWQPSMGEELRGTPRPGDEGGYYVKFDSIEEGLATQAQMIAGRTVEDKEEPDTDYGKAEKVYEEYSDKSSITELKTRIREDTGWTLSETEEFIKEASVDEMQNRLNSKVGPDGNVHPDVWNKNRQKWIDAGYDAEEFDDKFADVRDPDNPYYEVSGSREEVKPGSENYWKQEFRKLEERGNDLVGQIRELRTEDNKKVGFLADGLLKGGYSVDKAKEVLGRALSKDWKNAPLATAEEVLNAGYSIQDVEDMVIEYSDNWKKKIDEEGYGGWWTGTGDLRRYLRDKSNQ